MATKPRNPMRCSIAISRLTVALALLRDQHTPAGTRPMMLKVQAGWPPGIIPDDNLRMFADRQRISGTADCNDEQMEGRLLWQNLQSLCWPLCTSSTAFLTGQGD